MLSNFHDLDISPNDVLNTSNELSTQASALKVTVDDCLSEIKLVKLRNNFVTVNCHAKVPHLGWDLHLKLPHLIC